MATILVLTLVWIYMKGSTNMIANAPCMSIEREQTALVYNNNNTVNDIRLLKIH